MCLQALKTLQGAQMVGDTWYTYKSAMAHLFRSDPDSLANVFLEDDFCIPCDFKVLPERLSLQQYLRL